MRTRPVQMEQLHAIVPVNILRKSKERLSQVLGPVQRLQLTVVMLRSVLSALRGSKRIKSITVVSADTSVRSLAREYQATFVWEGRRRGLNKGVRLAIARAEQDGVSAVLIIHADLPLVTPEEIDRFLRASESYQVAIGPSKDGGGTNALFLELPSTIRPAFGRNSFKKHYSQAQRKNLRCNVLRYSGISFDVDEPKDVYSMTRFTRNNSTTKFLQMVGVGNDCS